MKKNVSMRLALVALIALVLAPFMVPRASAAADVIIAIDPTSISAVAGADFSVDVTIDPLDHYVTNADLFITYDQTKFTLSSITASPTFSVPLGSSVPSPADGTASYSASTVFGSHISSITTYATLNFHAVAAATNSPITITNATMVYADNSPTYPADAGTNVAGTRTSGAVTITGGDTTGPIVAEVTPVTTPTSDTTPNYTFSTNEAGVVAYGGDCSSTVGGSIGAGNHTVTFATLSAGTHSNCTVTVTDAANNPSNVLAVTAFTIETTAPTGGSFVINNGDTEVGVATVTLGVTCPTDSWTPVQMAFGNSASPTNWTTCAASVSHTLSSGNGTKTVYMRFRDGGQNTTSDVTDTISLNIPDTAAPAISNGTPVGRLSSSTKSATISVVTDENATCKFSTSAGTAYDSMGAFTTTGGTTHSFAAGGLDDDKSYAYYVKCADSVGNITTSDYAVSFSIKEKSSSKDDDKKKTSKRTISQSKSKVARGATLMQRGKKFSKKALVLLYFSKPGGGYYAPVKINTSSSGKFTISYKANKPAGKYSWYAVDTVTGKKSKTKTYTVK